MSRPVKYIAVAVVVALLAGLVTGIAFWTSGYDPDKIVPGLYINGKMVAKAEEAPALISFGETEVPFSIYRHYYLMYSFYYKMSYGQDFLEQDPDGDYLYNLLGNVDRTLKTAYAVMQLARENGIELDAEELASIAETLAAQKEEHGANFEKYLLDNAYLDEANYNAVTEMQTLVTKARSEYLEMLRTENGARLEKEADEEYLKDNMRVKHILISPMLTDEDGHELSAEEGKKAAEDLANQLLEQIHAGEDTEAIFDELMFAYSEDGGLENNPNGYTFKDDGSMARPFADAAKALAEGEVSGPVWNSQENYSGYHILLRLPLDEEDMEASRTAVVDQKLNDMLNEKLDGIEATMPTQYSEYYDKLTADSMR